MRVPEDRAHLARGEVEDPPPVGAVEHRALRALDDHGHPRWVVTDDVALDVGPEGRVDPGLGEQAHAAKRYLRVVDGYLNPPPGWKPTLGRARGTSGITDLLDYAGVGAVR